MSYLADAHRDWHTVHGNVVCPLDCGIEETFELYDYGQWDDDPSPYNGTYSEE